MPSEQSTSGTDRCDGCGADLDYRGISLGVNHSLCEGCYERAKEAVGV